MFTYIQKILNQNVLNDRDQKLLGKVPVIRANSLDPYLELISRIPDIDDPEMFGLPLNGTEACRGSSAQESY